jgi:ATP-binding cassette subfamily F protein 3
MDEPTNHLDMRSKEILKQALKDFKGTIVLVSHDRGFLDGLVNCVYEFKDKKIVQHLGGIYDFIQKRKIESLKELEKKQNLSKSESAKPTQSKVNEFSFEERKEISKQIKKAERQVTDLENKIAKLESEIAEMDKKLAKPENADDKLFTNYEKVKRTLERTLYEWELMVEQFDELQNKKTW